MKNKTILFGCLPAIALCAFATPCNVWAQSLQSFETLPIIKKTIEAAPPIAKPPTPELPQPIIENPYKPHSYSIELQAQKDAANQIVNPQNFMEVKQKDDNTIYAIAPNKGPLRMNYYRVPMNVIALDKAPPSQKTAPVNTPKPKAKTVWDYFKKDNQAQKDNLAPKRMETKRGPWRAIYEDTKTAIAKDMPQALADSLPWVDYERKNVPLDQVLDKVADGLNRANKEDPEWAASLKPELLDLARKMENMSTPPQYKEEYLPIAKMDDPAIKEFKKRPVWPGAKMVAEEQVRPFAINSQTEKEFGGNSQVLTGPIQVDNFDDEKPSPDNSKPKSKKPPPKKKH